LVDQFTYEVGKAPACGCGLLAVELKDPKLKAYGPGLCASGRQPTALGFVLIDTRQRLRPSGSAYGHQAAPTATRQRLRPSGSAYGPGWRWFGHGLAANL